MAQVKATITPLVAPSNEEPNIVEFGLERTRTTIDSELLEKIGVKGADEIIIFTANNEPCAYHAVGADGFNAPCATTEFEKQVLDIM